MRIRSFFRSLGNLEAKEQPLINILTRTSGRPIGFKVCHQSIISQTYGNYRHIVSYDDDKDLEYLQLYKIDKIKVQRKISPPIQILAPDKDYKYKPYNLYCNQLMDQVKEGWIMFLDDDDMLSKKNVLEEIVSKIKKNDSDTMLFWKTRFPNGISMPSDLNFKEKNIILQQIDTACFIFHSKYKNQIRWDCWWAADFRFIQKLSVLVPKQVWISKILTNKNNFGDQGNRNDLPKDYDFKK